jgi:hypothetical protein
MSAPHPTSNDGGTERCHTKNAHRRAPARTAIAGKRLSRSPFAIRQRDFQQQPTRAQTETISRVLRLLHDEARRRQNQPSALARLAKRVYGVRSEDL